eukprot:GHVT01053627.1.p2 GENE.GHVT01053627.1~~GHVT01053627.1.p2  ORF type:complete len:106 (+),score=1.90 GHVT01053627.1:314-631(+)
MLQKVCDLRRKHHAGQGVANNWIRGARSPLDPGPGPRSSSHHQVAYPGLCAFVEPPSHGDAQHSYHHTTYISTAAVATATTPSTGNNSTYYTVTVTTTNTHASAG